MKCISVPRNDSPNNHPHNDYAALLSNSIKTKNLKLGRVLHSHLIKTALILNTFFGNRLIEMYSKCEYIDCAVKCFNDLSFKNSHSWNIVISASCHSGRLKEARHLLDQMPEPNIVSFNSLISSYGRRGFFADAVAIFRGLQKWSQAAIFMDEFTVVGLANACAGLSALVLLRQVHGAAVVMGLDFNLVVCNSLIDAYGKCGSQDDSQRLFCRMDEKDVISWTSMVVAYASASRMEDACCLFNQMPVKNTVSWTALLTGFVRNGEGERALSFLTKMLDEIILPNDSTYVSALTACAGLALIRLGKQIHCRVIRTRNNSIFDSMFVINALIDMYCKCGNMGSAMKLFERFHSKDIIAWNSIIAGFAENGQAMESLAILERMINANVRPNDVSFIGILLACSHSGLVSEGLQILDLMKNEFGIIPQSDHFAILVDLLGRKNRLQEALEVIQKAPYGSHHVGMWGSLLGSCRIHGNLEIATRAAEALLELEPGNTGRYVMLANIYAAASQWDEVGRIRRLMDRMDLKKLAGSSWIEVNQLTHVFVAESMSQLVRGDVQELVITLVKHMKDVGSLHTIYSFLPS